MATICGTKQAVDCVLELATNLLRNCCYTIRALNPRRKQNKVIRKLFPILLLHHVHG